MKYLGVFLAIIAFQCISATPAPGLLDTLLGGLSKILTSLLGGGGGGKSDPVKTVGKEYQKIIDNALSFRPAVPDVVDAIRNVKTIAELAIALVTELTEKTLDKGNNVEKLNEQYFTLGAITETLSDNTQGVVKAVIAAQPPLSKSASTKLNQIMGSLLQLTSEVNTMIAAKQFDLVAKGLGECNLKKQYILVEDLTNWYEAQLHCKSLGLELASIESQQEQDALNSIIRSSGLSFPYFWLGGYDMNNPGTFSWVTSGKPMNYTNWNGVEPNNPGSCLEMYALAPEYSWVDEYCTRVMRSVCQSVTC